MRHFRELLRGKWGAKGRQYRQKDKTEEKTRQAREGQKILSKKQPTVSIKQSEDFQISSDDPGLEMGAILVVDDNEADLDKLTQFLSGTHLPIHRATNMGDALQTLRRYRISMLVTDIVLPMYRLTTEEYKVWEGENISHTKALAMGIPCSPVEVTKTRILKEETTDYSEFAGFKLLDEARKVLPWLPVIVVSRYANLDMARQAIGSKVQDILSKQVHLKSPDTLLASVRAHMVPVHQRIASLSRYELLEFLAGASEQTVTLKVLVPLFHKLGYQGLRYTHGTNECGLDLLFHDVDKLGIRRYMGAQVKASKIHKSVGGATSKNILTILQQVQQAFESTLFMLPEKTELALDRIFVISSKSVTQPAREYIRKALMGKVYAQHIEFWDGDTIADLILGPQESSEDDWEFVTW